MTPVPVHSKVGVLCGRFILMPFQIYTETQPKKIKWLKNYNCFHICAKTKLKPKNRTKNFFLGFGGRFSANTTGDTVSQINPSQLQLNKAYTSDTEADVPRSTSYGVYISQLIRFARASSHVAGFNTQNKLLTQKLLKQGYQYHKLRKTFSNFYR